MRLDADAQQALVVRLRHSASCRLRALLVCLQANMKINASTVADVLLCVTAVLFGGFVTSLYYDAKISKMEKANAEAVAAAEKKNAQGLAKATDTINLAQAEYDDLRAQLDRARARLHHADSARASGGSSADAASSRIAQLEDLVRQLVDAGSECGRLYQRAAANHDALAETINP